MSEGRMSLVNWRAKTAYPNRKQQLEFNAVFRSPALSEDLTVTGNPVLGVFVSSDTRDVALFAYIEDVAPDGSITYITEGQLRLIHRVTTQSLFDDTVPERDFSADSASALEPGEIYHVELGLLPVSYRIRAGHRIQLSLARADADNFAPVVEGSRGTLTVHMSLDAPSQLRLPIEPEQISGWQRHTD